LKKTPQPKKKVLAKKKKSLRDEFKMDIRDMIVKKRIASLNASAIMSASYAHERSAAAKSPSVTNTSAVKKEDEKKAEKMEEDAKPINLSSGKKIEPEKVKPSSKSLKSEPPASKMKKEESMKIVEIEDERIKSLLIASAMKKAGKKPLDLLKQAAASIERKKALSAAAEKLPPKKRSLEASRPSKSKKLKLIRVDESSSGDDGDDDEKDEDDTEEEIEEITTEGARMLSSSSPPPAHSSLLPAVANPLAMKHEMNKLDHVIVDGRGLPVGGMYQVVHRFETISTHTSVVPRNGAASGEQVGAANRLLSLCMLSYRIAAVAVADSSLNPVN
jgi:hypothetical protein